MTTIKKIGYARVSTGDQTTENQRMELESRYGPFDFWFADDGVSGSTPAAERPKFSALLQTLEHMAPGADGKRPAVIHFRRVDRLGRDTSDILASVERLKSLGVGIVVHELDSVDLSTPTGEFMLTMLAAIARMERAVMLERTMAGLRRSRAQGVIPGRKPKLSAAERDDALRRLAEGESVSSVARLYSLSRTQIRYLRKKHAGKPGADGSAT